MGGEPLRILVCGSWTSRPETVIRSVSEMTALRGGGGRRDGLCVDRGRVGLCNGLTLELVGVRPPYTQEALCRAVPRTLGLILLLDSEDPWALREAGELLRGLPARMHAPAVVAASGHPPGADLDEVTVARVRAALGLTARTPVLACDAGSRASVRDVLLALLTRVLDGMERESAAQREWAR